MTNAAESTQSAGVAATPAAPPPNQPAATPAARMSGLTLGPMLHAMNSKRGRQITFVVTLLALWAFSRSTAPSRRTASAAAEREIPTVPITQTPATAQADPAEFEAHRLTQTLAERDAEIRQLDVQNYLLRRQLAGQPDSPTAGQLRAQLTLNDRKLLLAQQLRAAELQLPATAPVAPTVSPAAQ